MHPNTLYYLKCYLYVKFSKVDHEVLLHMDFHTYQKSGSPKEKISMEIIINKRRYLVLLWDSYTI